MQSPPLRLARQQRNVIEWRAFICILNPRFERIEMTATVIIALSIVFVALIFDFTNGFHDAANSIATVVSTRVLAPRYAVIWAALLILSPSRC